MVPNLTAHLGVEWRPIENNVYFARLFARQNCVDNRFRLEEIVTEEFRRLGLQLSFFDTDFLLLLCLACAIALFIHQSLESSDINSEPTLARHQFGEIERKTVRVIKFKRELAGNRDSNGERGRLARSVTRLAGHHRRGLCGPYPLVVFIRLRHPGIPRVSTDIVELLFQVALRTNHAIKGFILPNALTFHACNFVNTMRRNAFECLQSFA